MCLRKPTLFNLFTLFLTLPFTLASPLRQQARDASPCGRITSALTPVPNTPPNSAVKGQVPAQLAWDCLNSVPLNATAALELVESIRPYVSFQSNLAYLKNPPPEYAEKLFGPVDLYGGLDNIAGKIKGGDYENEYTFAIELYTLFQSSHDGHLNYVPDIVGGLVSWQRPMALVSVSEDGDEIPAVFAYTDILLASQDDSFEPSPIEEIDNYDYEEYLLNLSTVGSLQDRDALWNTLFYSLPQVSLGTSGIGSGIFSGGGRGRFIYPGASTTIKFENGTVVTLQNTALIRADFGNVTTGQDVYDKFFRVTQDQTIDLFSLTNTTTDIWNDPRFPQESPSTPAPVFDPPGYPPPVARSKSNEIGGYFLDAPGYEDVAVLTMPSFAGSGGQDEFQSVSRTFLSAAKDAGKKKLIIDVSANAGGTIWLGYEIFLELFPNIDPYGGNRFRAHQTWNEMGKLISNITTGVPRTLDLPEEIRDLVGSPMNYRSDLQEDNKPFESWAQKYGPHLHHGDLYTTTQRWNLDDPLQIDYSGLTQVTAHGLAPLDLPFKAEDIVIVYDGYCASTCTIFSEFMRQQVGIETIAMGGRLNDDMIQAVGGTKGTNNWSFLNVLGYVIESFQLADQKLKQSWIGTEISTFDSFLPYRRASGRPGFNMRDGVRRGDPTTTPLQFWVEPADCRLYYTADMTVDITKMWTAAADAKWFGTLDCVAGSLTVGSSPPGYGNHTKLAKRAKQGKNGRSTRTVKVSSVEPEHLAKLEQNTILWTEFDHDISANGIMMP